MIEKHGPGLSPMELLKEKLIVLLTHMENYRDHRDEVKGLSDIERRVYMELALCQKVIESGLTEPDNTSIGTLQKILWKVFERVESTMLELNVNTTQFLGFEHKIQAKIKGQAEAILREAYQGIALFDG